MDTEKNSQVASAEGLRETFAEGLHKAMCFAPTTLHNRLACERPLVYLGLAEALLGNPAVQAALRDHSDSRLHVETLWAAFIDMRVPLPRKDFDRVMAHYPVVAREYAETGNVETP